MQINRRNLSAKGKGLGQVVATHTGTGDVPVEKVITLKSHRTLSPATISPLDGVNVFFCRY